MITFLPLRLHTLPACEKPGEEQLVDNNFRNMRRRDEKEKGSEYVKKVQCVNGLNTKQRSCKSAAFKRWL